MKLNVTLLALAVLTIPKTVWPLDSKAADLLLKPYADMVKTCAVYGTDMRTRLKGALAMAETNSVNVLPPAAWELIGRGLNTKNEKTQAPAEIAGCDAVLNLFRDPQFATYFRQGVAAQFVTKPALQCIVEQPNAATKVRTAWLTSFNRHGFSLTEDALDAFVSQAMLKTRKNRSVRSRRGQSASN